MFDATPADLMAYLLDQGYFADLDESGRAGLEGMLSLVVVEQGAWLFRQGDPADATYVLHRGVMQVILSAENGESVVLDVIDPGTAVGELALLSGRPRAAGVRALSDSALIRIPNDELEALSRTHPALRGSLLAMAEQRFRKTQLGGVLNRYFGDISAADLQKLTEQMTWRHVSGGETVFRQGDFGDSMVIVVNGRLRIVAEMPDGSTQVIGEAGRGQSVGEFALLTQAPRAATVVAVRDSDLLQLSAAAFERLSEDYPPLVLRLARDIARRDQQRGREIPRDDAALALAVLPLSATVPAAEFTARLAAALARHGRVLALDAASFDREFGHAGAAHTPQDDPLNVAITGWLNQQEFAQDVLVYVAEPHWSEWTQRCVRGADRLLLLADATAVPEPGPIEQALQEMTFTPRADLVLLQPETIERPSGTARWLDPRDVTAHYHVRLDHDGDIERLARHVSGRAIGLVLSGGAARGYVHLGVAKALAEAGIPVDILGGTSMGALMSAVLAMDFALDQVVETIGGKYGSKKALLDLTLPVAALHESRKVSLMLQDVFGDVAIEDLWRPYFCLSTNMTRAEPVVHRRGPLWLAVRASLAIPGVFSPVSHEGDLLIDGGVMNNLPIDRMREAVGGGYVIAVNANPRKEKTRAWDIPPSISGWQVFGSRLNPLAKAQRVPSLAGTILRAQNINGFYLLEQLRHLADLMIEPDAGAYNIMDWSAYPQLIEIGYEEAQCQLADWPPQQ